MGFGEFRTEVEVPRGGKRVEGRTERARGSIERNSGMDMVRVVLRLIDYSDTLNLCEV